jgi:hypothetical protein
MANPQIRIQLSGTDVTAMDVSSSWTLANKVEKIFTLTASDGSQTLDFSNISNVNLLVFYSASDFIITLNQFDSVDESIPLIINGGVPFVLPTTEAFIDSLSSIQISTTSTTNQDITIRAYGEASS